MLQVVALPGDQRLLRVALAGHRYVLTHRHRDGPGKQAGHSGERDGGQVRGVSRGNADRDACPGYHTVVGAEHGRAQPVQLGAEAPEPDGGLRRLLDLRAAVLHAEVALGPAGPIRSWRIAWVVRPRTGSNSGGNIASKPTLLAPPGTPASSQARFLLQSSRMAHLQRQERHHEVSSHFRWHQEHEHPQRAGRPAGQTDCRVQRPLHSHRDRTPPRAVPGKAWRFISGRAASPMCELGWKSLGVLELTALPSIDEELWVPLVQETDVLLVNGGDALYLCHWMRQSGLADLLPSLRETVYVGLSAGSMVMTPSIGEDFVGWKPPTGGDQTLGLVDFCDVSAPGSRGSAGQFHGRRRKMGRRHAGAGVRDRRSDRHQSDRRHRRSRLRGALEAVYPP